MHRLHTVLAILALPIAVPALAQLSVPSVSGTVGGVLGRVDRALDPLEERVGGLTERATRLADARVSRLATLVRRNRDSIEIDKDGQPARKGELLLMGASEADLAAAERAGFTVLGRERLGELDIAVVRLGVPTDTSLARAEANLQALLPNATIAADSLHFPAGTPGRGFFA